MRIQIFILILIISTIASKAQVSFTQVEVGDLSFYPGGQTFEEGATVGGTWVDLDNDGDIDFIDGTFFYENDGVGQFIADSLPISGNPPSVVDLNNDGLLDMIVGGRDALGIDTAEIKVLINQGSTFNEITLSDSFGYFGTTCIDINNDGYLDILLMDIKGNKFYINDQGRSFAQPPNFKSDYGSSIYGSWADYDKDGDMDLLANGIYQNQGAGSFEKVNEISGTSWGDVNNDGWMDFYGGVQGTIEGKSVYKDIIYINNGDQTFSADTIGYAFDHYTMGSSLGDLDNDGDLDLIVTSLYGGSSLYWNVDGKFEASHFSENAKSRQDELIPLEESEVLNPIIYFGVSLGDLNQDGHLDALIGTDGGSPNEIWRNSSNANNWLMVQLEGSESNPHGIGAQLSLETSINGVESKQYRTQRVRHGPHAGNLDIHFGLGDATIVNKLTVEWPSGNVTELSDVDVKQWITINEDMITAVESKPIQTSVVYPNPSRDVIVLKSAFAYKGPVSIEIHSLKGERVRSAIVNKDTTPFEYEIDIQDLPIGTYVITILTKDVTFTQKLIKE